MNLRSLRSFLRLAENACDFNIHKKLGTPRSSLWAHINDLEKETGLTLIARRKQNNTLTEEGKSFIPYAKRLIKLFEEGIAQARKPETNEPEGEIIISTTYSMANSWLMSSIKRFQEFYPKIRLRVLASDYVDTTTEMVADILFRPIDAKDFLVRQWCFSYNLCLLASPDYLSARGVPETPKDLLKHALVGYGEQVFSYCPEIDWHLKGRWPGFPKLDPILTINSTLSLYQAALEGIGICSGPLEANLFYKGKLVRVLPHIDGPRVSVYFTTKKDMSSKLARNVQIFNNFFVNHLKNLCVEVRDEQETA